MARSIGIPIVEYEMRHMMRCWADRCLIDAAVLLHATLNKLTTDVDIMSGIIASERETLKSDGVPRPILSQYVD